MNFERIKQINEQRGVSMISVKAGQKIKVYEWMGEGNNRRIRRFEGLVIKVNKPGSPDGNFTMRGKTSGVTIEKIYPLSYVNFDKVELLDEFKVRKSKLYYIREKIGKDARMKTIISQEDRGMNLVKTVEVPKAQPEMASQEESIQEQVSE